MWPWNSRKKPRLENHDPMVTPSDILAARNLIVDDQMTNVAVLEQMLRGAGYRLSFHPETPH
jgi:PleD family two-component response regulator